MQLATRYATDSPEALARLLALTMMCDASFHPLEVGKLDALDAYRAIGLSRDAFLTIASECFDEQMMSMRENDRTELVDDDSVDDALDALRSVNQRGLAYRLVLALLPADGRLAPPELALLQRLIDRWQLDRTTLERPLDALLGGRRA